MTEIYHDQLVVYQSGCVRIKIDTCHCVALKWHKSPSLDVVYWRPCCKSDWANDNQQCCWLWRYAFKVVYVDLVSPAQSPAIHYLYSGWAGRCQRWPYNPRGEHDKTSAMTFGLCGLCLLRLWEVNLEPCLEDSSLAQVYTLSSWLLPGRGSTSRLQALLLLRFLLL